MFKQALFFVLLAGVWLTSAFTPAVKEEKWVAKLVLEGKGKSIVLTSDAIYGGYNAFDKKIFLFGKNHMFSNPTEQEAAKVFHDLCVINSSGQFQFEINGVSSSNPGDKGAIFNGNVLYKKKSPIQATFKKVTSGAESSRVIEYKGDLKMLGLTFTEEATKLMTGKFTLTFTSKL